MTAMERPAIAATAKQLADEIRECVRDQIDLWRLVPGLALEADGRQGYSDRYRMAYRHGYWDVGSFTVFVDLATGELVCFRQIGASPPYPASDDAVRAYAERMESLDAHRIVDRLRSEAGGPTSERYDEKAQAAWRDGIRRELGDLGEVYDERNRLSHPRFDVIF